MYIEKFKEMFTEVTVKKNASMISKYYHENLLLFTNGQVDNYEKFLNDHIEHHKSSKQYEIEYDDETFLEQGEKLAGRIWITVSLPNDKPKRLELIIIAQYKDDKIYRLWEVCYPDWSQLPEFKKDE